MRREKLQPFSEKKCRFLFKTFHQRVVRKIFIQVFV